MKIENINSKLLEKAYAGSIRMNNGDTEYRLWTNPLLHPFYEYIWRKYFIGCPTMLRDRNKLKCEGVVHWDVGMKDMEYKKCGTNDFILYAIKTRKDSSLLVIKDLLSKIEELAKNKGKNAIYGYSNIINPKIAKRFGWESYWRLNIWRFRKKIQ